MFPMPEPISKMLLPMKGEKCVHHPCVKTPSTRHVTKYRMAIAIFIAIVDEPILENCVNG